MEMGAVELASCSLSNGGVNTEDAKASGGNISFYNGKTIHAFTGSGTFANPTALNGGASNPLTVEISSSVVEVVVDTTVLVVAVQEVMFMPRIWRLRLEVLMRLLLVVVE